ncbi:hypothetical protein DRE_04502 [Drechslerella stenobrocha 248]|uniref:Uncharacterized protein n=1 Tax=Drechslerella stenobrocha 248 TaxID=1043628 RepID=W7HQ87_9PEZI|nr:hypothetical protein DRE_04502 [Drechslerella stenobrocha 248]
MPNKHYLHDSDLSLSFSQKRHVSAPSRYTPVQAPRTPLYSPITQAPSPISPSRDDMMMIDKPEAASPIDCYDIALLTPQETKRSTASPPAMFQSPKEVRPASLDGRLVELSRKANLHASDINMEDDDSDEDMDDAGTNVDSPAALMSRYFRQTDLNPDVIALKCTIEMLRKRRQQCLGDIGSLSRMKDKALARPDRFAERVVAASQGAQKTNLHQGKHHWRLEDNTWDVPGPIEIPRVPAFQWQHKYRVPPMYKNHDLVQAQALPSTQPPQPSSTVQDMINPNSSRMTTRATNSARSTATSSKPAAQQFNIRTGLDMANRQKKNSLLSYSSPYMTEFNSPARPGQGHPPIPYFGTPTKNVIRTTGEAVEFLKSFVADETVEKVRKECKIKAPRKRSTSGTLLRSDASTSTSAIVKVPASPSAWSSGQRHASMPTRLSSHARSTIAASTESTPGVHRPSDIIWPRLATASKFPSGIVTIHQRDLPMAKPAPKDTQSDSGTDTTTVFIDDIPSSPPSEGPL